MTFLELPRSKWIEAQEILRTCGQRCRECVVYLCGAPGDGAASRVSAVYHPEHEGSAIAYEVPIPELSKLNVWSFQNGVSVLLQAHTHPGAAFHSRIDDARPTIETAGFLSLVVPEFGRRGLLGLSGCYLAEYLGSGIWRKVTRDEMLDRIRLEK